jgi:amidase
VYAPDGTIRGPSKRRLRIAIDLETLMGTPLDGEVRAAIEDTARMCAALGHKVEVAPLPLAKREFAEAFVLYWSSGAARIADGLQKRLGRPLTNADLEPWTLGLRNYFLQRREQLSAAIATLQASSGAVGAFFDRHDVLLTPVLSKLTPRVGDLAPDLPFQAHFDRAMGYLGFTPVQNASGTPGMSVPLHWSRPGSQSAAISPPGRRRANPSELAYELEAAHLGRLLAADRRCMT